MNITRFSIERPVGICMIVMLFVVLGLYSFHRIGVELLPALNTPYVTVSVNYSGAGTEEVEQQVIKPLEDSLASLSNLKHMTAIARPERAIIILEFELSTNSDFASIEATKKVNSVRRRLPDGIDEPVVVKRDINAAPVLEIAVTSKYPLSDIYAKANSTFKERLEQSPGVSEVSLYGGRDKEIAVEVDKEKLAFYNLSLSQIVNKVKGENALLPSGSVYTDKLQTDVRLLAQYQDSADINNLNITNSDGISVPITEIAIIKEKDSKVTRFGRVNGQDAISLTVYKNSDANIVTTVEGALKQLETLREAYPDYEFTVVTNSANFVSKSLNNTLATLFEGLLTTGIVLYLFLRGWRSTAAVMIAIPTSLISTFLAMYAVGFSFNMMSLMGMALCVGILVDDSIVVLENIHRHLHMGKDAKTAAVEGRMEIGMAAIAITLCDVVVFMPIAFMSGMTGQFFQQFALTIVLATLFSLFVSFTLTPMLASKFFRNGLREPQGKIWVIMDKIENQAIASYERWLVWSLDNSRKIIASVLLIFILSVALIPSGIIGAEYMPRTDESSFRVSVELPVGQNIEQTDAVINLLEQYVRTIPEVTNCLSSVGTPTSNNGSISVQLIDRKERSRSVWQITDDVRKFARSSVNNAVVRVNETQSSVAGVSGGAGSGGSSGSPVQIELLGNNLENLVSASYKVQKLLGEIDGVKDIRSSYSEGMPELQLTVDRERLKFYNTSVTEITSVFSAAIAGQKAGVLANDPKNDGQDTDIIVRLQGSDGFKAADIQSITVGAGNRRVFLSDVAKIEEGTGPVMIRRVDKQRAINVQANLTDRPLKEVLQQIKIKLDQENVGSGVTYRFTGQANSMDDTFREMIQALALSLVLVYMLLAVLYESLLTPFIRMFSLPLGLIGSLIFLLITNNTINLYSLIGILVMDGLVAKNGTLLLDYTLTLMDRGMSAYEAVIEAGKTRLKPIFMTTLTMVVGMLPTALSLTEGSETRVSMAWVIIGGLLSSTFFTLIVIPIIFLFFTHYPIDQWHKHINLKKLLSK
ncbi:efflux RND transporter permease subunit [Dendrosporobacter sp. 1207_IL3150]|uniref:efflux RND transporter permease subunit n=1 Tax=Dendrosporobacter sp. 1207_IL3150 TaxID=3084054 RepID=UPI002FD93FC8